MRAAKLNHRRQNYQTMQHRAQVSGHDKKEVKREKTRPRRGSRCRQRYVERIKHTTKYRTGLILTYVTPPPHSHAFKIRSPLICLLVMINYIFVINIREALDTKFIHVWCTQCTADVWKWLTPVGATRYTYGNTAIWTFPADASWEMCRKIPQTRAYDVCRNLPSLWQFQFISQDIC